MLRHEKWFLLIGLSILLFVLAPTKAQETPSNPLLEMLALVPASAVTAEGEPIISYADYRAVEAARGIPNPGSREGFLADEDNGLWINAMTRLTFGPAMSYALPQIEGMPEVVGFDFFSIDQGLLFGMPPRTGTILAGYFDAERIGAVLATREFERVAYQGVTIWRRFDDLSVTISAREPADPFGGQLGQAARIAVLPGEDGRAYLTNSAADDLTQAMVDAAQDAQSSLADLAAYRALTEAITDPVRYSGPLIQASIYSAMTVGMVPADPGQALTGGNNAPDPTANYGTLPIFALAMLADRQEGDEEVHLIALTYTSAEVAQAGAEELAARLRTLALPDSPDDILVERFKSTVTPYVYKSATTGQAVAVVEVRQVGPALGQTNEAGMLIPQGLLFRSWVRLLMQRQFFPLWLLAE